MSAIVKVALAVALMTMAGGAMAETGGADNDAKAVKTAAWDRVGDGAGTVDPAAATAHARARAPGEEGLNARKAEMVRRMFWIMLAHR